MRRRLIVKDPVTGESTNYGRILRHRTVGRIPVYLTRTEETLWLAFPFPGNAGSLGCGYDPPRHGECKKLFETFDENSLEEFLRGLVGEETIASPDERTRFH